MDLTAGEPIGSEGTGKQGSDGTMEPSDDLLEYLLTPCHRYLPSGKIAPERDQAYHVGLITRKNKQERRPGGRLSLFPWETNAAQ